MESIDLSHFAPQRIHTQILPSVIARKCKAIAYEVVGDCVSVVLDSSHTPESSALLAHHLKQQFVLYEESSHCFFWILRAMEFIERFYTHADVDTQLQHLLQEAIALESSDIHIEHKTHFASIRLRIDGVLREIGRIELEEFHRLATKLKLDAKLDITEVRVPQDGRFHKHINGKEYDFRISCMPLFQGESIVLRILYKHERRICLDELGLSQQTLRAFRESIRKKSGLILVVGPTGSGKSTTLYALLEELKTSAKKLITIEDPIEYQIPIATQIQLNPDIGFSFYEALKCVLRQDPDIIMVGEIRDAQTLELALNASLTGHLVLASLHSHDCISSLERLFEMGTPRSVLATSLLCIVAQRLVGRLCEYCKQPYPHDTPIHQQGYIAKGCEKCSGSGIKGRVVLSQSLFVDEKLRTLFAGEYYDGESPSRFSSNPPSTPSESLNPHNKPQDNPPTHAEADWRLYLRVMLRNHTLSTLQDDAREKIGIIPYSEIESLE